MTHYITFRTDPRAGGVLEPGQNYTRPAQVNLPVNQTPDFTALAAFAAGKDVIFLTHGFNVNQANGEFCLSSLEASLGLSPATTMVIAVLWPGDWHVKGINYFFEPADALRCGRLLSALLDNHFRRANTISFASHSLGARVILEAASTVSAVTAKLREVAVLAAACDAKSLGPGKRFDKARQNAHRISVLSSKQDNVLKYAFPLGDLAGDPFGAALGYRGPKPEGLENVEHTPISGACQPGHTNNCNFDHGDYFPGRNTNPVKQGKWSTAATYMRAVLTGGPRVWP